MTEFNSAPEIAKNEGFLGDDVSVAYFDAAENDMD